MSSNEVKVGALTLGGIGLLAGIIYQIKLPIQ